MTGGDDGGARRQAWSDYWRAGPLHSLAGSFQDNYEGPIRAFWEAALAGLTANDRVLDIGTGNGALPALACALYGAAMPAVDAIDIAAPDPAWLRDAPAACRKRIRLHGDTAAEATGFDDGAFSMVVSQYGIEYSDLARSLPEAARITRPGGRLALVVHHAGSRLREVAATEVAMIDWLLGADGLMAPAGAVLPYMALAARGERARLMADPAAGAARERFNAAMRALEALAGTSPFPDALLDARARVAARIDALLRGAAAAEEAAADHAAHERALLGARLRSEELCVHALDEGGLERLLEGLRQAGFTGAEAAPLHHGEHLVGWAVRATRGD